MKGRKKCVPKAGSCQELNKTNVVIKIEWPCKTKERCLPEDLHQIGKMLCRGTYKQIANAVWRHLELRTFCNVLLRNWVKNVVDFVQ